MADGWAEEVYFVRISRCTFRLLLIANQPINGTGVQTSGDGNVGRGRVNRRIAQEVDGSTSEIALLAQALVWRSEPHLLAFPLAGLGFPDVSGLVGVYETGRNGVDADPVGCKFYTEDFGKHHDAAFRGVVRGHPVAWQGDVGGLRGNQEDATGLFLLDQVSSHHLSCEECAANLGCGSANAPSAEAA
jgi:hypothetical protein